MNNQIHFGENFKERIAVCMALIEHYRMITRSVSIEYYKTITLAYAAGLIALATTIITLKDKISSGKKFQIFDVSTVLAFSRFTVFIVAGGMILSIIGYFLTYWNAKGRRDYIAKQLHEVLLGDKHIDDMDFSEKKDWSGIFATFGALTAIGFIYSIVAEALIVFMLI